jgi:AcrR family transcriptional regulator
MTTRRRGSEDSRSRLLEAATRLFAEQGYEQTTVREIGQQADVDPALIARYFGSKALLYVEALRPEESTGQPIELTSPAAVRAFLDRIAPKGPTPALHAAIRPHDDPELQATAMSLLEERLLAPLEHRATASGLDHPQLRSELVAAAVAGIILSRSSGAFPELTSAATADLGPLIADLVASLVG